MDIVFCVFSLSPSQLRHALGQLTRRLSPNRIVVVNNSELTYDASLFPREVCEIAGSNRLFDISAYVEGAKFLDSDQAMAPSWPRLFINDTLFQKLPYRTILSRLARTRIPTDDTAPAVAASFVAGYHYLMHENPWSRSRVHLCSAAMLTNADASATLIRVASDSIVHLELHTHLRGSLLGPAHRQFFGPKFSNYLTYLALDSKKAVWQPVVNGAPINEDMMLKKAYCFYVEHRFSAELDLSEGGLIPINSGWNDLSFRVQLSLSSLASRHKRAGFRAP